MLPLNNLFYAIFWHTLFIWNIRYLLLIQNNFLFGISDYVYLLLSYGNELFFPFPSRLIQTNSWNSFCLDTLCKIICYNCIVRACPSLVALQQYVLSNKKGIFIETILSVILLKISINIWAKISIIYKLQIRNRSTSLRETYVTFHSNQVTCI